MLTIVIGGSGSGKSEYAENLTLTVSPASSELFYLATMEPTDAESRERIQRHRQMRAGKGFQTIECPTGLSQIHLSQVNPPAVSDDTDILISAAYSDSTSAVSSRRTVLLECVSNLVANEMFSASGAREDTFAAVQAGILHLVSQADEIIIVTNNVFEDGNQYDADTRHYLSTLGQINRWLCETADTCVEVVHGIPIYYKKGATLCNPCSPV